MNSKRTSLIFALFGIIFSVLALNGCTTVEEYSTREVKISSAPKSKIRRTGEVYLLRGLANVFSTGLDSLGQKFKAKGFQVKVQNHTAWQRLADDIIIRSKKRGGVSYPIIIMGHSFGADSAVTMANYLGRNGIRVSYVVAFDPTHPGHVDRNVRTVVNYYHSSSEEGKKNHLFKKGPGFSGRLQNIDVAKHPEYGAVHHLNIDKNARIHSIVINKAMSLTRRKRS